MIAFRRSGRFDSHFDNGWILHIPSDLVMNGGGGNRCGSGLASPKEKRERKNTFHVCGSLRNMLCRQIMKSRTDPSPQKTGFRFRILHGKIHVKNDESSKIKWKNEESDTGSTQGRPVPNRESWDQLQPPNHTQWASLRRVRLFPPFSLLALLFIQI